MEISGVTALLRSGGKMTPGYKLSRKLLKSCLKHCYYYYYYYCYYSVNKPSIKLQNYIWVYNEIQDVMVPYHRKEEL